MAGVGGEVAEADKRRGKRSVKVGDSVSAVSTVIECCELL